MRDKRDDRVTHSRRMGKPTAPLTLYFSERGADTTPPPSVLLLPLLCFFFFFFFPHESQPTHRQTERQTGCCTVIVTSHENHKQSAIVSPDYAPRIPHGRVIWILNIITSVFVRVSAEMHERLMLHVVLINTVFLLK